MDKSKEKLFCCKKCFRVFVSKKDCKSEKPLDDAERGEYWYYSPDFYEKCPHCGSVSPELKVDITGYNKDSGVIYVKIQNEQQDENKMDENSAIVGLTADIDEITKKLEKGKQITPDDIAAITKNCNNMDMWQFLVVFLLLGYTGGNSSAEYWRGKYEAYKELHDKMKLNKN